MTKFSVLSLAVLLAAGTGFAGKTLPASMALNNEANQKIENAKVAKFADTVAPKAKVAKKIQVNPDKVTGTYDWSNQNLMSARTPETLVVELTDEATGLVEITGWVEGEDFKVLGNLNYETGVLSIPNKQYIGDDYDGFATYFYLKNVDGNSVVDGASDVAASEGYFDGDKYVFPTLDVWALGDPEAENMGFWIMTYANVFVAPFDEVQEGMWEYVGPCTIEDAWILPAYGAEDFIDPVNFPFTADLEKSVYNENLYRVWRPYRSADCPIAEFNESAYNGQIVFDITDPDHVIVKAGYYAGFGNSLGEFCNFGMLGWQIYGFGSDWDPEYMSMVIDFMEEKGQEFDTFKDNVLTVNASVFDNDISCANAYSWTGNPYVVTKITLPSEGSAVSDIEVENAPVKYFNLQGVEVANPAAGQIVICRQGDKATKKIFK